MPTAYWYEERRLGVGRFAAAFGCDHKGFGRGVSSAGLSGVCSRYCPSQKETPVRDVEVCVLGGLLRRCEEKHPPGNITGPGLELWLGV